jgi:hypothetical protein
MVKIGTQFRNTYADGNPMWTVTKKLGRGVWEARINANEYDFAGVSKSFRTSDIEASLRRALFFEQLGNEHNLFYASLTPGQIVHYHNGFGNFVRCEVVSGHGENALKPIALVGEWRSHDLPSRAPDGSIRRPYHVEKIAEGETMTPSYSLIFESPCFNNRYDIDPRTLDPVDLTVPEMTAQEVAEAKLVQVLHSMQKVLENYETSPQEKLNAIVNLTRTVEDDHASHA